MADKYNQLTDLHGPDRLSDFNRDPAILKLSALALIIGIMSAFIADALIWLIRVITNLSFYQTFSSAFNSPSGNHLGLAVIAVPVIGGLIIGLMARYGTDKIRGHGIPEALEAILIGQSRMSPKVALLKPVSSAISIGTGGPFGAEGPIIMTGGAFGSLFAQFFHLTAAERKTLLVAGAAGGMAAIFAAPIAAVLLAVELLLFEWKPRSFIPVAISSITAEMLRVKLLGPAPMFTVIPHAVPNGYEMFVSVLVGFLAGLGSSLLTVLVYSVEDAFKKISIHWMWWPALGGLGVGLGGLINPKVMGVGYDVIQDLLRGNFVTTALVSLLVVKTFVWVLALGSGTSGGVLAPLLIIGGALGALEAHWIPVGDSGLWTMLSMAAVMGGTMRAPLTSTVFALELTHDFNVIGALFVSCVVAYAVTVFLMRRSILTEKVARRGFHISREYSVDPLELLRVSEVMDKEVQRIPSSMLVVEFMDLVINGHHGIMRHRGVPIVDEQNHLIGMVIREDVMEAFRTNPRATMLEVSNKDLVVAYPDELVKEALHKMLHHGVGRLPVVSRKDDRQIIGYLGRPGVFMAWMRRLEEEGKRDRLWR
ncbi:MAG: chloride channel protein [Candidatus Omnitrophica bacterium]|nr:chloride channel protein [Candidatus Omnitrophota bacterium]MDE2009858.1 chloride channel protein [Candidatus Omnitrophota bacterium]MDE2214360.1 chloride channel protein [Candidatus Omnitrophota bacterium]MDE2231109.1 chloride channel protein [Candidatus Omnitrophota bacterium]